MKECVLCFARRNVRIILLLTATFFVLVAANIVVASRNFILRHSLDDLKQQIASQEAEVKSPANVAEEDAEIESFLNDWQGQKIDVRSIPALVTQLANHATALGLQVVRITPGQVSTSDWLLSCPFEAEFSGTSKQFLKFLGRFEHETGAVVIRSVAMERVKESDSDLRLRIDFTAYGEKSG
ncbi:MAG: type 4a pilus biogenesis protein PilO [Thermogutta sp.]